jgi:hypothetical protein
MVLWPHAFGQNNIVAGACDEENCLPHGGKEVENSYMKRSVQFLTPKDTPLVTYLLQQGKKFHSLSIIYSNCESIN